MRRRGRLTVTDILWYLIAVAALAGLFPVAQSFMDSNSAYIPNEASTMLMGVAPMAVIVLLSTIYIKARVGRK